MILVVGRDGERVVARIVETEAYGGLEDLASHATMYRVGRESIGSDPGVLYMQKSYGLHTMTNIVAHEPGAFGAVLLRAAEDPVEGIELVRMRRGNHPQGMLVGPGSLSKGMGTRLDDTLRPLGFGTGVFITSGPASKSVMASPRIGISRAVEVEWRFFEAGNPHVSRHRRGKIVGVGDLDSLIAQLPEANRT